MDGDELTGVDQQRHRQPTDQQHCAATVTKNTHHTVTISADTSLRNELLCVEWNVTLHTHSQLTQLLLLQMSRFKWRHHNHCDVITTADTSLQNELSCVQWNVTPYTLTYSWRHYYYYICQDLSNCCEGTWLYKIYCKNLNIISTIFTKNKGLVARMCIIHVN